MERWNWMAHTIDLWTEHLKTLYFSQSCSCCDSSHIVEERKIIDRCRSELSQHFQLPQVLHKSLGCVSWFVDRGKQKTNPCFEMIWIKKIAYRAAYSSWPSAPKRFVLQWDAPLLPTNVHFPVVVPKTRALGTQWAIKVPDLLLLNNSVSRFRP